MIIMEMKQNKKMKYCETNCNFVFSFGAVLTYLQQLKSQESKEILEKNTNSNKIRGFILLF